MRAYHYKAQLFGWYSQSNAKSVRRGASFPIGRPRVTNRFCSLAVV
jgi:hypothetical protein